MTNELVEGARGRRPHLGTLVLLTALTVLTLNMFLPALPQMRDAFGVSEAVMGLAISGYMALAAVLQLVLGPLSDRYGRRPVLLASLALYALASLGCLLASDIGVFLAARMGQALAVGGAVLASAVVRDLFDEAEAAAKLGTIGAAMAIAPMLAPVLGGYLDAFVGWRAIFAAYFLIGVGALLLTWWDLHETKSAATTPRAADYAGLLRSRAFWAYAACASFAVGAFYIFLTGAPFVGTAVFGLSADQIGLGLGSITGGFMVGAALTARFAQLLGPGRLMMAGRVVALAGLSVGLALFLAGADHVLILFSATICVGLGNGLTLSNAYAGLMSIRADLAGTAAGLAGALMLAAGAALTAVATTILTAAATPERLLSLMVASVALSLLAGALALRWRA
jgi:DHA1 family bicyclomycin/chloramphenicol resistance-like MFS transporter